MSRSIKNNRNIVTLTLMIVISCLIQVLTIMKSSIVAGYFGTTSEMDAFNFSNSIVTFIYSFVAAGISTIVIPEYVKKNNRKEIDSFLTAIFVMLPGISLLAILLRIPLISGITNRDESFVLISGNILIVLFVSNYFSSVTNVTGAYFQCEEKYNTPKIINLISQIVVVGALILFREITIYEYAWIIAGGLLLNFILDTGVAVKCGWRYKPTFHFNDKTKEYFRLFLPVLFSTGIYRVSLMVDSALSSRLNTGYVTMLSYSNQISGLVNTLIVGNLLIYIYPKIVKNIKEDNSQDSFWNQAVLFHSIICLITLGFAAIGEEGIALLFEHGKFEHSATLTVFYCCLIYIFGQQSNVIRDLIYRYFYALGDTKTAAKNSLIVGVTNIVISIILSWFLGIYGIVLGTIIASAISLVTILIKFKQKIGFIKDLNKIFLSCIISEIIMIVSIAIIAATKHLITVESNLLSIFIYGIEAVIIFGLLTYFANKRVVFALKNI